MASEYLTVEALTLKDISRLFTKIGIHPDLQHDGTPCWIWSGYRDKRGYGRFKWRRKFISAHRFTYAWTIEPIPANDPNNQIDHLCRRTSCVNPCHLEVVDCWTNHQRGNTPDAINSRKTHCKRGHPLSGANLTVVCGLRVCKICRKATHKTHLQTPKGKATRKRLERARYTDPAKHKALKARRNRRYAQRKLERES